MIDPIEPGGRLFHVGLPKTGTTAVQTAAASMRGTLREHGVVYPGRGELFWAGEHSHNPDVFAVNRSHVESATPAQRAAVPLLRWGRVVRELDAAPQLRGFVSAEAASQGERPAVEKYCSDLGERTHVVFTLRNLGERLLSDWQQHIRSGEQTRDLDSWLRLTFGLDEDPDYRPYFSERAVDPATTLDRWIDVFGVERVTVVVVDKAAPTLLYDAFEQSLELPHGMLRAAAQGSATVQANRGWSLEEVEFARQIRIGLQQQGIAVRDARHLLFQGGLLRSRMHRSPGDREHRLRLPQWAAERANAVARRQRDRIVASGVRIIGDPDEFARPVSGADDAPPAVDTLPLDLVVQTVLGTVARALQLDSEFGPISAEQRRLIERAIADLHARRSSDA